MREPWEAPVGPGMPERPNTALCAGRSAGSTRDVLLVGTAGLTFATTGSGIDIRGTGAMLTEARSPAPSMRA